MNSGGESPPLPGGEFLLRLLHHPPRHHTLPHDPPVTSTVIPTVQFGSVQSNGQDHLGPRGTELLNPSFRNLGLYHNGLLADSSKTHHGNTDREFIRFSDNFYNSPNLSSERNNSLVLNGYEANFRSSTDSSKTHQGNTNGEFIRFSDNFYNSPNLTSEGNSLVSSGYEANYRNSADSSKTHQGNTNGEFIRFSDNFYNSPNSTSKGNNSLVLNGFEANYRNSTDSSSGGSNRYAADYQNSLNYSSEGSDSVRRVNYGGLSNLNKGGNNRVSNGYESSYGNSLSLGRIGEGYDRPNMELNGSESAYRNSTNLSRIGEGYNMPNRALNGSEANYRNSPNLSRIREGYDRPNKALNGFEADFRNSPDSSRIGEGYRASNGFDSDFPKFLNYGKSQGNISRAGVARQEIKHTPPGFSNKVNNRIGGSNVESSSNGSRNWGIKFEDEREKCVPPTGSAIHSVSGCTIEESLPELYKINGENGEKLKDFSVRDIFPGDSTDSDAQVLSSIDEDNGSGDKNQKRREDYRSDTRGQRVLAQWMRKNKRMIQCRNDIDMFNAPLLAIFDSLVPPEEEKMKQKQLLAFLEKLVVKEWPEARLLVYGSCANSFGVKKSDIDICLAMKDPNVNKSKILLKLADILIEENLENVQALTRARVPVVKLMDPATQISCDICCNNVLAVVNSKLLRDYAKIDGRLRQLAFIVKHWAKLRGVNETYHGTLSSYAYVLMCIHFLQQCRPAILPCLQGMDITYKAVVENVECAFFDQVEKLAGFGLRNKENIGQLVWGFFRYWAYCHDYTHDVVSVREGSIISKQAKDWTRRVGNDRHLICIEDPFETTHDLGRVVDKFSIKVLREEFERAAQILQFDPNPCVTLFEPYVRS